MAWRGPRHGVHVVSGGVPEDPACRPLVGIAAISLAWIPDGMTDQGSTLHRGRLRMYEVTRRHVTSMIEYSGSDDTVDGFVKCAGLDREDFKPIGEDPSDCDDTDVVEHESGTFVEFLDANAGAPLHAEFVVEDNSARTDPILGSTCVPRFKLFSGYYYAPIDYTQTGQAINYGADELPWMLCRYSGVKVVQLPNDRWFMAITRDRVGFDSEPDVSGDVNQFFTTPHCADTDAVYYVADDPSFRTNLQGPFWLVDAKSAVSYDDMPPALQAIMNSGSGAYASVRMYVGVAAVVVAGDYLYVYYTFASNFNFDDRQAFHAGGDPINECDYGDFGDAAAGRDTYTSAMANFDGHPIDGGSLGVRRIALADLYAHISSESGDHERYWDLRQYAHYGYGTSSDPLVSGEVLGRVRAWVTPRPSLGASSGTRQRFESAFDAGSGFIDPAPIYCSRTLDTGFITRELEGHIALIAPYRGCLAAGEGCGMWRMRSIVATVQPFPRLVSDTFQDIDSGDWITAEEGRDFYIDIDWDTTTSPEGYSSPDLIVNFDEADYADPDAAQLPDGTWRVGAGGGRPVFPGQGGMIWMWRGQDEDACG